MKTVVATARDRVVMTANGDGGQRKPGLSEQCDFAPSRCFFTRRHVDHLDGRCGRKGWIGGVARGFDAGEDGCDCREETGCVGHAGDRLKRREQPTPTQVSARLTCTNLLVNRVEETGK